MTDSKPHEIFNSACECGCRVEFVENGNMLVHHSAFNEQMVDSWGVFEENKQGKVSRIESCTFEIVKNIPPKENMDFGVIYISEKFEKSAHLCFCGECGEVSTLALNGKFYIPRGGVIIKDDKITFLKTVDNRKLPCKSRYVIVDSIVNFISE